MRHLLRENSCNTKYLERVETKHEKVENAFANFVKIIESGILSDTMIKTPESGRGHRTVLLEDNNSTQAYFDKFLHADVNDLKVRD